MKVVSDTGPINYLVLIGHVSLLPALFGVIWIPEAVRRELGHADAPLQVRQWIGSPPQWLLVRPVEQVWTRGLALLGDGERDSIALALSSSTDLVLMDDRLGVSSARSKGLEVTGTLSVLERGAGRGLLELVDAFDRLRKTSFRVRSDLLEQILTRHRRRQ